MSIYHSYLVCKRRLDRSSPMGYGSDASLTRPSRATAAAHSGSPPALYSLLRLAMNAPRESAPVPVWTGHRSARSSAAIRGRTDPRRCADVGMSPYGDIRAEGVKSDSVFVPTAPCGLPRGSRGHRRSSHDGWQAGCRGSCQIGPYQPMPRVPRWPPRPSRHAWHGGACICDTEAAT